MTICKFNFIFLLFFLLNLKILPAQWQWQNPLPFGDPVKKIFFFDNLNGWALPRNETLLRTFDGGENWFTEYTNIIFDDIHFIDKHEGWGIGRTFYPGTKSSIYHSTDGGHTWEIQLADTNASDDIFFIDRLNGWATAFNYLLQTQDGGINWQKVAEDVFRFTDHTNGVLFLNDLKGWAVGGLLYGAKTTDGGLTWEKNYEMDYINKLVCSDSLHLWGTSNSDFIIYSKDCGESWQKVTISDTTAELRANDIYALDSSNVFVATNLGLYRSKDGGFNWEKASSHNINTCWFHNPNEGWTGGGNYLNQGFYNTRDGTQTWNNIITTNNDYGVEWYRAVDFISTSTGWIIGDKVDQGSFILKTIDSGKSWITQSDFIHPDLNKIMMIDENHGWIAGDSGTILYTSDGGNIWEKQNTNAEDFKIYDIYFINSDVGWAVGGGIHPQTQSASSIILNTQNGGQAWSAMYLGELPRLYCVTFIDSLYGWAAGGGSTGVNYGRIFGTTDGGKTWKIQKESDSATIRDIVFADRNRGWAVGYDSETGANIFHTSDGGRTWSDQISNSSFLPLSLAMPTENIIFTVGLSGLLFYSDNNGMDWKEQETYTTQMLRSIDFVDSLNGWIVGNNGTLLHTDNCGMTAIKSEKELPIKKSFIILKPSYPNPFNSQSRINVFNNGALAPVEIFIYDILGRKIRTVYKGYLQSGLSDFIWDGKNENKVTCSSGMYIIYLSSNQQTVARKMLKMD